MKTNEIRNAFTVIERAKREHRPLLVFDTETTGLDSKTDTVIQVSAQKIDPETFKMLDEFDVIINPLRQVSEKITEITGYTNEFLSEQLPEEFVFMDILEFFGEHPIVVGHNVDFDIRFMSECFMRNGKSFHPDDVIDTCRMARQILKKGADVENHRLGTVASYYGVDSDLTFHEAQDDVKATVRILVSMLPDERPEEPTLTPVTTGVSFFLGFRGHQRLYFYSNAGSFWWDNMEKRYGSKDFDIENANLDPGVSSICQKWHVQDISELFNKVRNWWFKKQEERIGEEKQFSDDKTLKSYLSKNSVFDYTQSEENGITTIRFVAVKKSGTGKRVETA